MESRRQIRPRSTPKWQLVGDLLATSSVTRGGGVTCRGMTRDRDVATVQRILIGGQIVWRRRTGGHRVHRL